MIFNILKNSFVSAAAFLVTSEQMASEINRTGRIALYGLYFDTNRTEIKSESKPTSEQIADLLNGNQMTI
jgi:hypothetical protein